jgi:predicted transcriptional regulator
MPTKNSESKASNPTLVELEAIKRLLVLQLLQSGATQSDIAYALQIDRSAVSRMIPVNKLSWSKVK